MSKPADFLIGVSDFFTILLPGILATWLAAHYLPADAACLLDLGFLGDACSQGFDPDITVRTAAFLLTAYMLGHFTFMAGSTLDRSYNLWRKWAKPESEDSAFHAATCVRKDVTPDFVAEGFSTLKWSRSYIQILRPTARGEIDRFEANSKFFRGLVVVSVLLVAHFLFHGSYWGAVASFAFGAASYWRYVDQRWKQTELTYATAAIVHAARPRKSKDDST